MKDGLIRFLDKYSVDTVGRPVLQYAYVTAGFFFVLLCAGTIFGWSSLLLVLQAEGVYSELCVNSSAPVTSMSLQSRIESSNGLSRMLLEGTDPVLMCAEQALRYDLIFLIGLLALFFSMPLHGWIMDWFGARISNAVGAICIMLGLVVMAFGYHTKTLDLFPLGLILYSSGGAGVSLAMFPLARIKHEYISIILAIYNSGFDSGPIVFYVYVKIYQSFGVTPKVFFLSFCIVPALGLILSIFWPKGYGEPGGDKPHDTKDTKDTEAIENPNQIQLDVLETTDQDLVTLDLEVTQTNVKVSTLDVKVALGDTSEVLEQANTVSHEGETSELGPTDLYSLPFLKQFTSRASIMTCFWNTTFTFWLSTYMGSIQSRLNAIETPTEATKSRINTYTESFGLVLSLAFLVGPFLGILIHKLRLIRSVYIAVILGIIWCLCQFLPSIQLQLITFVVFAIVRAWHYSIAFNVVSQLFGWVNVGRMWGSYSAVSGFVTIGFYGISWSVVHLFNGSYTIPNLFTTATIASTLIFAFYLQKRKENWENAQRISATVQATQTAN